MAVLYPFLRVPAAWLSACGRGNEDKVFAVRDIEFFGPGRTFAVVESGNGRTWKVWVEERGATFLDSDPAEKHSHTAEQRAEIVAASVDKPAAKENAPESILTIANAKAYCRNQIEGAAILDGIHTLDGGSPVVNVRFYLLDSEGRHCLWTITVWVESNGELYGEW